MPPPETVPGRRRSDWRWWVLVAGTVAVQWIVTARVAQIAGHNGWLFGSEDRGFAAVSAAHDVAHGTVPPAAGPLHPLLLAPLVRATTNLSSIAHVVIPVQVLLLAPIASYCVLDLGRRIAGRVFAALVAAVWLLLPVIAIPYIGYKYEATYRDDVLPGLYGLTVDPAYLAMVLCLVAAVLTLRATTGSRHAALLAGLVAGAAIACVPTTGGIAVGMLAALALARRPRAVAEAAMGLVALLLPTLVWRQHAPGIPTFTLDHPSFHRFQLSMAQLREFTWSNRVLQWLPIAGAIGLFRLHRPAAALISGWFAVTTVVSIATFPSFDSGGFFIDLVPAWPAYSLLVASIPALVPTLLRRLGRRVAPESPTPDLAQAPSGTVSPAPPGS